MTTDKAVKNAVISLEMEGFRIDEDTILMCRKLLENEITWEQYMDFVMQNAGISGK